MLTYTYLRADLRTNWRTHSLRSLGVLLAVGRGEPCHGDAAPLQLLGTLCSLCALPLGHALSQLSRISHIQLELGEIAADTATPTDADADTTGAGATTAPPTPVAASDPPALSTLETRSEVIRHQRLRTVVAAGGSDGDSDLPAKEENGIAFPERSESPPSGWGTHA